MKFDADNYYLSLAIAYDNDSVSALVEEGEAVHAFKVECRRNFHRQFFRAGRNPASIAIPAGELLGRVDVAGLVVATRPVPAYRVTGAHADYGEATFRLSVGDLVAVAQPKTFDAYTDYDPLRKVSSFLVIRESEDHDDGPMELDTEGDRIVATLSKGDYRRYTDLRADAPIVPLLANQVIVPALVQALSEMASDKSEEQRDDAKARRRWYRSVDHKLRGLGVDLPGDSHTPLHAAQLLLHEPLRRSLATLLQATAEEED